MRALLALSALLVLPAAAKPRVKDLVAAFNAGKTEDRTRLAGALGRLRESKATDALLQAYDPKRANPKETLALTEALGRSGDPRAVDPLAAAWDYMRTLTMQMGELPGHLQVLRGKILEALSRLGGDQAVSTLSAALNDADPRVVEEAVHGLGRLKVRDAVPALQQLAASAESANLRQAVFEALGHIGDKRAVSTLRQGLASPDKFVELQAVGGLARLGDKEMIARLQDNLKNDPGAEKVGVLAGYYLVRLDKDSGLDHLSRLCAKKDTPFAAVAAEALGKTDNPRAALALLDHLRHDEAGVRVMVARGLSRLGGSRAVSGLRKLQDDQNASVRNAAIVGLVELGELD